MPGCLGCGMRPHLQDCPEDKSVSRQLRWQRRKKANGHCVTCGKKVTRKNPSKLGVRTPTTCSVCRKLRRLKESKDAPIEDVKAA